MTARAAVEWGDPRPAEWHGPRECLSVRLPPELVREVRERARVQGVSLNVAAQRLLERGLGRRHATTGASPADLVTTLFD
ncbi:MAG: hypothetical protein KQH83_01505 [Actinobacteria bacterium]|nr:hypothetical protein [Actinomycetota bacterium]